MKKIKHFIDSDKGKDILTVLIVILVGLGSFQLGRLSKENVSNDLKIDYKGLEASVITPTINKSANISTAPKTTQNSSSGEYFASNRGSKYYPLNCSAGKSIKDENKIYFLSAEIAEKAGYELSSACE
ncbi:MAG: hypothetical protein ABH951_01695 [Patescibacteria group bacterium]